MNFREGRWRLWGWFDHRGPDDGGAASVFTIRQRWALLLLVAVLTIVRLPQAWAQGRFLCEEGGIFFAYAWHRPATEALFRSFAGYLNLGANAVTLLDARLVRAGVLSLENAPYLTMVVALLFQLLPAVLLLTARGEWLSRRWAVMAALLMTVLMPKTEEIFTNTLHIQFYLMLCAGLILALGVPPSRWARFSYALLLFLAPLCGPGAIVLLPIFALRTLVDRTRARLAQTVALAFGSAVQLFVFFTPSPVRGQFLDPVTLAATMFIRLIVMPLSHHSLANRWGKLIHASREAGGIGWWIAAAIAVACFGALLWTAWKERRGPAIWLVLAGLAFAIVSFGGGMIAFDAREYFSVGSAQRYNFLPLVLLGLALVVLAQRSRTARVLCALILLAGAIAYPRPQRELGYGPAWSGEVAVWRLDHDHPLRTWPGNWTMDLSDHDRPCSMPPAATDPTYCEGPWLARVAEAARPRSR